MKYTLSKRIIEAIEEPASWIIEELDLPETELIESLNKYLSDFMQDILDPDVRGKRPDGYLRNLQNGILGDFSKRYIIVAKDDDCVIGLLIALPQDNNLHIYSMGVSPEYRNQGVATVLLAKCIDDTYKKDISKILLDVHSENIPAINLYRKFGFQ